MALKTIKKPVVVQETEKEEAVEYYRHPEFGHVYGNPKLVTPVGRLIWPWLSTPQPLKNGMVGKPKYSFTLLLPAESPKVKEFFKKVETMAHGMVLKYNSPKDADKKKKGLSLDADQLVYFEEGEENNDVEKYPYYKNTLIIRGGNTEKMDLISLNKDARGNWEVVEAEKFVAGIQVRGVLTPILTKSGISYKADTLQFVKDDGVRYGRSGGKQDSSGLLAATEADLLEEIDSDDDDDMDLSSAAEKVFG